MRSLLLLAAIAAAQTADGSAQSVPAAPGDRFENWLFTAPAAWVKREDVDGLTLTSPDGQAEMRLLPGEELSTIGLDTWLEGQLVLQERGLRLEDAEAPQTAPSGDHYEWLMWRRWLRTAQGRIQIRTYVAANPRARAELVVYTALSEDARQRHLPVLAKFVETVRFANVLGVPKPPPRPLPAIAAPSASDLAKLEPIPDEFRCYVKQMSDDYSSPDLLLQILPGRQYRTEGGTGSFDVAAPRFGTSQVQWRSGPLATPNTVGNPSFGTLGWQEQGQLLLLSNVPVGRAGALRDVNCYQRGAREALAREAFARLDPQPGSYPCLTMYGKDPAGTLQILPGRRYRYDGAEGAYSVNIMDFQLGKLSTLKFFGGPLEYGSGTYGDEPPGRQSYSVSARVSLECRR